MAIDVRPLRPDEARTFLEIHRASIRGLAANDYAPDVINDWAPVPVSDTMVEHFLANRDQEVRLIAELDGVPAGIGCLVIANAELRACYVITEAARHGVGSAIVAEIERLAKAHGLTELSIDSSVTAVPFYTTQGYVEIRRQDHVLRSGRRMAAVQMKKTL